VGTNALNPSSYLRLIHRVGQTNITGNKQTKYLMVGRTNMTENKQHILFKGGTNIKLDKENERTKSSGFLDKMW
jgi:hypothetical protein